ncbi:hypothetical protein Tco_0553537 [Tanacetum coccineum]
MACILLRNGTMEHQSQKVLKLLMIAAYTQHNSYIGKRDQESELKKSMLRSSSKANKCKGPHYTKDCPLKEEGKILEEAYYMQLGRPFQCGGYRATTLGFYQRNNANPSYQERRQSMKDTLSKFMSESTKRHEENST